MNAEDQRIVIAETCGWTDCKVMALTGNPPGVSQSINSKRPLPDYLNDLNTMHEAEKRLFASKPGYYERAWVNELRGVVGWSNDDVMLDLRQAAETAHATATQRAEAFLRTIGKWSENPA